MTNGGTALKAKTVLAWHFVKDDGTNRDGIKEKIGKWYKVEGKIEPCKCGLHGSIELLDSLGYSPGCILRRTEHRGTVCEHNGDKIASSERRALWQIDATKILHLFACDVAEKALKDAKVTDKRSWDAIKIKRLWIQGKATNEELSAAYYAANSAAYSAANSAANYAAYSAAYSAANSAANYAANSAAYYAANYAAYSAANSAANYAAYYAAYSAANYAAYSAANYAAYDAANYAAKYAAYSAANKKLERMIMKAHKEASK